MRGALERQRLDEGVRDGLSAGVWALVVCGIDILEEKKKNFNGSPGSPNSRWCRSISMSLYFYPNLC